MNLASKLLELSFVLPLVAAEGDLEPLPCDACGTVHNPAQMACVPSLAGEAIGVSWACAGCLPETNRTRGENLQGYRPVAIEKVDKILLDVGDSIDHDILRKRNFAPYVRRVLFAERERAREVLAQALRIGLDDLLGRAFGCRGQCPDFPNLRPAEMLVADEEMPMAVPVPSRQVGVARIVAVQQVQSCENIAINPALAAMAPLFGSWAMPR
jgi:hypothetical protein